MQGERGWPKSPRPAFGHWWGHKPTGARIARQPASRSGSLPARSTVEMTVCAAVVSVLRRKGLDLLRFAETAQARALAAARPFCCAQPLGCVSPDQGCCPKGSQIDLWFQSSPRRRLWQWKAITTMKPSGRPCAGKKTDGKAADGRRRQSRPGALLRGAPFRVTTTASGLALLVKDFKRENEDKTGTIGGRGGQVCNSSTA